MGKVVTAAMKKKLYTYLSLALRNTGSIDIGFLVNVASALGLPEISYDNASSYLQIFNDVLEGVNMPASVSAAIAKEKSSRKSSRKSNKCSFAETSLAHICSNRD